MELADLYFDTISALAIIKLARMECIRTTVTADVVGAKHLYGAESYLQARADYLWSELFLR